MGIFKRSETTLVYKALLDNVTSEAAKNIVTGLTSRFRALAYIDNVSLGTINMIKKINEEDKDFYDVTITTFAYNGNAEALVHTVLTGLEKASAVFSTIVDDASAAEAKAAIRASIDEAVANTAFGNDLDAPLSLGGLIDVEASEAFKTGLTELLWLFRDAAIA